MSTALRTLFRAWVILTRRPPTRPAGSQCARHLEQLAKVRSAQLCPDFQRLALMEKGEAMIARESRDLAAFTATAAACRVWAREPMIRKLF